VRLAVIPRHRGPVRDEYLAARVEGTLEGREYHRRLPQIYTARRSGARLTPLVEGTYSVCPVDQWNVLIRPLKSKWGNDRCDASGIVQRSSIAVLDSDAAVGRRGLSEGAVQGARPRSAE